MPKLRSVLFGITNDKYSGDGNDPAVAINNKNLIVAVHKQDPQDQLHFRTAIIHGGDLQLTWTDLDGDGNPPTVSYSNGTHPSVALTDDNTVVEVHDDGHGRIFYSVRTLSDHTVGRGTISDIGTRDDKSYDPFVAINSDGVAVEVHRRDGVIHYRAGKLTGTTLNWTAASTSLPTNASGENPAVDINKDGTAVAVFERDNKLFYTTGIHTPGTGNAPGTIAWATPAQYTTGTFPSVAITNDGFVFEIHQNEPDTFLARIFQVLGELAGDKKSVDWKTWLGGDDPSYQFDKGKRPQLATNGKYAVHVHRSEEVGNHNLYANDCLVVDRGNWMGDHLESQLGGKTIAGLVFPGSHDAAQYKGDVSTAATQTQTISIGGQLAYGVRWFDLRVANVGGVIRIHHGPQAGVTFEEVVNDVAAFMNSHNELVFLKLSHYGGDGLSFNQRDFDATVELIRNSPNNLRPWLLTGTINGRLADQPLGRFIGRKGGTVLVLADVGPNGLDYLDDSTSNTSGIRRYRDWNAPDPEKGDLTVFDIFSRTTEFPVMRDATRSDPDPETDATERDGTPLPRGQFPKFQWFDGICRNQKTKEDGTKVDVPCDLFLLSWTLTPATGVVEKSRDANRALVDSLRTLVTPRQHPIANILYTDVSQLSRSTDAAIIRNLINI